ncbi:hypothetical protein KC336_g19199 [Hortaea werneckii]|nr:hypothetical protein KC336_g19199 [Hortaea werneckii]
MEQSLSNWRSSLPSYFWDAEVPEWFRGPRQVVFWKEANIRILLLLASQKHQKDNFDKLASGKRYQAVAEETIVDISAFCSQHPDLHLGLSWYAIYFVMQATLALSVQHVFQDSLGSTTAADRERAQNTYDPEPSRSNTLVPPNGADAGNSGDFGGLNATISGNDVQDWSMAADPSFHMFFNGNQDVVDIFQDINGFPGTAENNELMDFGDLSWYG